MASPGESEGEAPAAGGEPEGDAAGVVWADVGSSAVLRLGLDEAAGVVLVVWHDGAESSVAGDRGVWEGLLASPSVGRAVNGLMRGG